MITAVVTQALEREVSSLKLSLAHAELCRNINIPWSKQGMGDADYIYAFQQIVMPIANDFDPDLVISKISCDLFRTSL